MSLINPLFSSWDTPGLGKRRELMEESCFPGLEDFLCLFLDMLGTAWQGSRSQKEGWEGQESRKAGWASGNTLGASSACRPS